MSKPFTIAAVSQSISIETKSQAMPSVRTASGKVRSLSTGFSTLFRIPKTSAAQRSVQSEPWKLTPLRIQPAIARAAALTAHEARSHLIMRSMLPGSPHRNARAAIIPFAHIPNRRPSDMTYLPAPDRYDTMEYRRCGRSGLDLPALSLGLWHNFGSERPLEPMRAILRRAFDLGVTHFDLANNYGPPYGSAEENFG